MTALERRGLCRNAIDAPPLTNISHGSSVCMAGYLIAARAVIILWTNLVVMPVEMVFDAIEAELERRGIEP
jgi:hypothetical protein